MAGLLEESGAVEAPTRPPEEPTDVAVEEEAVTSEAPEAPVDEVSDAAAEPLELATTIAYSENSFPKIVEKFKQGGAQQFPRNMSLTLLGIMEAVKSKQDVSDEVLSEVGVKMFEMLTEDMVTSGTVEGLTSEIIVAAIQESITAWAKANPEGFDPEEFEQEAMAALEESGEMPPVTPNPKPRNMVPDENAQPEPAPQQGGGMLMGGM